MLRAITDTHAYQETQVKGGDWGWNAQADALCAEEYFVGGPKGREVCQSGVKCDPLTRFATAWQCSMDLQKTKGLHFCKPFKNSGADCRFRTGHLMITNQLLYQMS